MSVKLTIDFVRSEFDKEGCKLLTSLYVNSKQKLEYLCTSGHRCTADWSHWNKNRKRCPICSKKYKPKYDEVKHMFEKEGYSLLTDKYINCESYLDYICPNGHKHKTTLSVWKKGYRCPICNGRERYDTNKVKAIVGKCGYSLIGNYSSYHRLLELVCPNNHIYKVSLGNWNSKNYRCPVCNLYGNRTSAAENALALFLETHDFKVDRCVRNIIPPYELDIVLSEYKIAIEYCGLYWHSELRGKDRNYHLNKLKLCEDSGYKLITIFEDEFEYNKNIVFSKLYNILDYKNQHVVFAKKTKVCEISTKIAKSFCIDNHIQGYISASVKLGAFYNGKLISVMFFSKGLLTNLWELNRFCSKINYRVVGIASKFLKYFKNNYVWSEIIVYVDRRWSFGNFYTDVGFVFVENISPNYWYIKQNKRLHRFALRKKDSEPEDVTEWDLRRSQGWNRIWDCGSKKYIKRNK